MFLLFASLYFINMGCKKIDASANDHGEKIMVRIVQVDKSGAKTFSEVVVAHVK